MKVRTRFAPSPTGFLHVGGVRTALFAWLFARKYDGHFILRIEDTDKEREVEGAIGHIMECLRWLGLMWDEGPNMGGPHEPYIQSGRLDLYKEYARKLIQSGCAYPDPYTEEEVEALRKKAEEEKRPFLYRNHRPDTFSEWDGTTPLRFCTPVIKRYEWNDLVLGPLSAGEEALDDFILIKGDGYPTYNFCHVVDDIEMEITHVMRGQEFVSSTPKFLSLYDALEVAPPQFATLPPILGEGGGKKLSKRDGAKDLLKYREEGYMAEGMVNFLALLGWNPGTDQEIFGMEDLIAQFDLSRIQRSGAQFDEQKLLHINQQWMRQLSDEEFIQVGNITVSEPEMLPPAVPLLKERVHTFDEAKKMLDDELSFLFMTPIIDPDVMIEKALGTEDVALEFTITAMEALVGPLRTLPSEKFTPEEVKDIVMPLADANPKETGGRGAILWPLRYSLTGQPRSPDPFLVISILGRDESVLRIQKALAILGA